MMQNAPRRLENKVALVAGASAAVGIGAAAAARLAAEGAAVVVADLNLAGAQAIAEGITRNGAEALATRLDISAENSVEEAIARTVQTFGGIDILHVNAADTSIRRLDSDAVEVPLEVFDQTLAVGLRGHLLCTRHAVPEMLKRGGGSIIYTSSDAAFNGLEHYVAYMVAKSGINALMRHVAARWGRENIRANAVSPGLVLTDTVLRDHTEESVAKIVASGSSSRAGTPEDVAALVAFLASEESAWINGQVYHVNGGQLMR